MVGVLERPEGPFRRRRRPARLEEEAGRGSKRFFFFFSFSLSLSLEELLLELSRSDMPPGIPCPMVMDLVLGLGVLKGLGKGYW